MGETLPKATCRSAAASGVCSGCIQALSMAGGRKLMYECKRVHASPGSTVLLLEVLTALDPGGAQCHHPHPGAEKLRHAEVKGQGQHLHLVPAWTSVAFCPAGYWGCCFLSP